MEKWIGWKLRAARIAATENDHTNTTGGPSSLPGGADSTLVGDGRHRAAAAIAVRAAGPRGSDRALPPSNVLPSRPGSASVTAGGSHPTTGRGHLRLASCDALVSPSTASVEVRTAMYDPAATTRLTGAEVREHPRRRTASYYLATSTPWRTASRRAGHQRGPSAVRTMGRTGRPGVPCPPRLITALPGQGVAVRRGVIWPQPYLDPAARRPPHHGRDPPAWSAAHPTYAAAAMGDPVAPALTPPRRRRSADAAGDPPQRYRGRSRRSGSNRRRRVQARPDWSSTGRDDATPRTSTSRPRTCSGSVQRSGPRGCRRSTAPGTTARPARRHRGDAGSASKSAARGSGRRSRR